MAYAELSIVVEGALESTETYLDDALLNERLTELEDEAREHGYPTKIYVMYHEHSPDLDCECIQFESSLKPKFVFNIEGSKGEWQ